MGIKFKKVERNCPRNDAIRAGQSTDKVLYDYDVIDNGEKTATYSKEVMSRRYELCDLSGRAIAQKLTGTNSHFVRTPTIRASFKGNFEAVYLDAKNNGLVPTQAQIEQRKVKELDDAFNAAKQEKEQERVERIHAAGVELLASVKGMLESFDLVMGEDCKLPDGAKGMIRGFFSGEIPKAKALIQKLESDNVKA